MNVRGRPKPGPYVATPYLVSAAAGLLAFVLLTAGVHTRALSQVDVGLMIASKRWASEPLDLLSAVLNVLFSSELSLLLGLASAAWLWRRGLGIWSLAPLTFLVLVALEVAMKMTVDQPNVPPEFHRYTYYPLLSVELAGSFPSGHAMRTAFFCLLAALPLAARRGALTRLAAVLLVVLVIAVDYTRVYLGHHWASDVVGGTLLGGSVALVLAAGLESMLRSSNRQHFDPQRRASR